MSVGVSQEVQRGVPSSLDETLLNLPYLTASQDLKPVNDLRLPQTTIRGYLFVVNDLSE